MHQHKRERLRHSLNVPARLCRTPSHLRTILLLLLATLTAQTQTSTTPLNPSRTATAPTTAPQLPLQPHTVRIRILNARTNQPITDERLNVALHSAQIGSIAMATDKNGIILVDTAQATTLRILSNMYADCRPRAELYTDYPLATIAATGVTTGNLCSSAHPAPKPGELTLFEIPRTFIPKAGEPPNTTLPHSDEPLAR